MKKRLQNILAVSGVASRRSSGDLIEKGFVAVDGNIVREKGARFNPEEHNITVNGKKIPDKEKKYYFLFNKPSGVISTVIDTHGRKKITDFFEDIKARLYPVGRLDKDTTGVMILTNDGELAHMLSHPKFGIEKEYLVFSDIKLDKRSIVKISSGVKIEGKMTSPCSVIEENNQFGRNTYRVKIHEGKKRQVRLMFSSVGAEVIELERVRYAGLSACGLGKGERRELTCEEINKLKLLVSGDIG